MTTLEPEAGPLGTKKTVLVIATVVGCIGILWPKVFHPMLIGSPAGSESQMPPGLLKERGPGCCDVVLDSELPQYMNSSSMSGDGKRFRESLHILFNKDQSIRQERPLHMRPEAMHPAMRERGFPSGPTSTKTFIEGRPGPIPGMRPPMGGGAFQPASPKGNSMGLIMPLYTVGIIAFFVYTILKIVFKKNPPGQDQPYANANTITSSQIRKTSQPTNQTSIFKKPAESKPEPKLVVTAIQGLIDAADEQLKKRTDTVDEEDQDSNMVHGEKKDDQQTVQVLGMEVTSTCEGGQKWDPANKLINQNKAKAAEEIIETVAPQEIFLEGMLPHESQILVSDSEQHVEEQPNEECGEEGPAIILSSKMTLSLINLDKEENANSHGINHSPLDKSKGSVTELVETIGSSDTLK